MAPFALLIWREIDIAVLASKIVTNNAPYTGVELTARLLVA
jgi:hypothetical protein